ncbi:ATPase [Sulfuricurvum sp. IAE1]|jgi:ATP-citrate lyase beta-subunit|uniref:ATP citrate lyase citrate-binding domain-containing protein n=1 Tax=Sulfuricurvum sp. IAE1 TaxID=2546102 RepID=UPI00104D371D|nr:ATP citrate lyase citrate-binding domain-containing protein [Sulfuricurvum sp. IAE1]MDX9965724.1 ATP citrate lyase citrate-binding domain-containing protein [Sulfuricurvum sp.]TDA63079.1 ATPase [Sulfuricurvum sp. IAE1]
MAQRAIREYDGKAIFSKHWEKYFSGFHYGFKSVMVTSGDELRAKAQEHGFEWLKQEPLVAKPDMLFGKRGKNNLVLFKTAKPGDVTLDDAAKWIDEKMSHDVTLLSGQHGRLTHFIVEPFTPHTQEQEYYISATTVGEDDVLYMSAEGGMEVEENWDKVVEVKIPITMCDADMEHAVRANIPSDIPANNKEAFASFAIQFFKFYRDLNFAYLEINPIVMLANNEMAILDLVARLDDTAGFMMGDAWCDAEYPTAFGMEDQSPEEKAIAEADSKSGASLKLTVLNPMGRIWTMVAGGGASVVYADTIADLSGNVADLANYGEYSGGPTTGETKFYADTVLDLMTRHKDPKGRDKILIIGGAIANFTDVAKTFTGIIQSFETYADRMKEHNTRIYVRRGGPNYEKGLKDIKEAADRLGLYIEVYGPETHVTDIVRMALEK